MNNNNQLAVANYFITKSNYTVTPLQLIKLSYISYGYTLAITGEKLFDEEIEAWKFGPVIPSIYHSFKHYGKSTIDALSFEMTFEDDFSYTEKDYELKNTDDIYKKILDAVWSGYSKYNGFELVDLTHQENTPWDQAYKEDARYINDEQIKTYYKSIVS